MSQEKSLCEVFVVRRGLAGGRVACVAVVTAGVDVEMGCDVGAAVEVTGAGSVDGAGVSSGEEDAVLLSLVAASRDADRFPDPDRFDPARDTRGHLGFGWGIHLCPGAALARAELTILLTTLCEHPPLRRIGEPTWSGLQGGNHLGPAPLPVGPGR